MATTLQNGITPAVVGNPIREFSSEEIKDGDLSMLFVTHGDSYDEKELIRMSSKDTLLKLHCNDNLKKILANSQYPNCYTTLIPHLYNEMPIQTIYPNVTSEGHKAIINLLPKLENINANEILITKGTNEPKVWRINYYFDGKYAIQEALFCGLEFIRWATNGDTWGSWAFKNDQNLIGTLRLDYINANQSVENTFKNRMGWITTDTTINLTQYPRLYRHIEKNWIGVQNQAESQGTAYWKDNAGGIHINQEKGFYPRFVGDGTFKGIRSNPDIPGAVCSDNIDYANKSWQLSGHFSAYKFIRNGDTNPNSLINFNFPDSKNAGCGLVYDYKETMHAEYNINSNRQLSSQNLKFSNNETCPKSKFFSLLIYAGYPA